MAIAARAVGQPRRYPCLSTALLFGPPVPGYRENRANFLKPHSSAREPRHGVFDDHSSGSCTTSPEVGSVPSQAPRPVIGQHQYPVGPRLPTNGQDRRVFAPAPDLPNPKPALSLRYATSASQRRKARPSTVSAEKGEDPTFAPGLGADIYGRA